MSSPRPAPNPHSHAAHSTAVAALFAGRDAVVPAIYDRILEALHRLGPFDQQPKKTSIHLVRSTGFAGIHPRKSALILNLRLDRALGGPRVFKSEQVSRNRYHNELKLTSPDDIDAELTNWLREAYHLSAV
jgi:hypothetical protein